MPEKGLQRKEKLKRCRRTPQRSRLSDRQSAGPARRRPKRASLRRPRPLGHRDYASKQGCHSRRRRLHQPKRQCAAQHLFPYWICSQNPEICLAFTNPRHRTISGRQEQGPSPVLRLTLPPFLLNRPVLWLTMADPQYLLVRYPGPDYMTRLVPEHDQPHIRSPFATAAPTSRLRRAGLRKTRTILENRVSGPGLLRLIHLDPSGLIKSRGLRDWIRAYRQAAFITAPSMTTPAVTYFQSATVGTLGQGARPSVRVFVE